MRANEFLTELFQQSKDWVWMRERPNEAVAKFQVGDQPYRFLAYCEDVNGVGPWEVEFVRERGESRPTRFGLSGTGNSAEVMSTVVDIMRAFLEKHKGKVTKLVFDAKEDSRQGLYAKMAKRLLPDWKLHQDGESFVLVAPKQMKEGSDSYQPPELNVGDKILKGKFKNSPAEIKGFTKDKHNQPVLKTNKGDVQLFKPRVGKLMATEDTVDEMALKQFTPMGDFDKPGPFKGVDKRLVPHPTNQMKTAKFFEQTPYDFRLFFSNIPGTGKYSETGPVTPQQLQTMFGEQAQPIIEGSEDAITVVFVGNTGDSKVMMTPWIMAHRFGHAIQAGVRKNSGWSTWAEAEKHFFTAVNNMLEEYYNKASRSNYGATSAMKSDLTPEYNALFNAIGTQRSSRSGEIKRPYEFLYEIFAQYLKDGHVTFNPLPGNLGYGRKNWGNPSKYMNLKPEMRDDAADAAQTLANDMQYMFDDVLSSSVGQIFVM